MVEAITLAPTTKNIPSITMHGDAADGFIFGVAAGALLAIYMMARPR